jgi:hypothetical protein
MREAGRGKRERNTDSAYGYRKVGRGTCFPLSVVRSPHLASRIPLPASRFPPGYQMTGLTESGLTIGSPGLHPNAAANCGMFEIGPLTLHRPGE